MKRINKSTKNSIQSFSAAHQRHVYVQAGILFSQCRDDIPTSPITSRSLSSIDLFPELYFLLARCQVELRKEEEISHHTSHLRPKRILIVLFL